MFLVGSTLTILDGLNMIDGLSTAATCLGNVGPAFGEMGPAANFSGLSVFSKYLLSLTMITGRLELYTIMLLFSRRFWNPYRY
jgi:trk system potassium uptake protein TrkH